MTSRRVGYDPSQRGFGVLSRLVGINPNHLRRPDRGWPGAIGLHVPERKRPTVGDALANNPVCCAWRRRATTLPRRRTTKNVVGLEPTFDIVNLQRPISFSGDQGPVAKVPGGDRRNALLGAANVIHEGVRIRNSIVRGKAVIAESVELDEDVIMNCVRIGHGARVRRVIVDRHNVIEAGDVIDCDRDADAKRFSGTEDGATVIPEGRLSYDVRATVAVGRAGRAEAGATGPDPGDVPPIQPDFIFGGYHHAANSPRRVRSRRSQTMARHG
jgi:hypothetical protein